MKQLTKSKTIRFSETQMNSLAILEDYGVNVNQFIRQATKEKLSRDWKQIKENKLKTKCPF
jgi:hypothetical protein